MAPLRTLASNLGGAIGCAVLPGGGAIVFVDYNRGNIVKVDLAAGTATTIGSGYTLLEDIVVAPDGRAYVTERTGSLLRVDLSDANRAAATVLHSGMVAPQQIALSADAARAYTVEYQPSGATGRLWRVDLNGPANPQSVLGGLHTAVGLALSRDERFALIGEQAPEGGRVSRYALAGGARQTLAANLPSPFFLHWRDARRTRFLLPLRDPHNRIVEVDLTARVPAATDILTNVPHRPSSIAMTAGAKTVVCSDREVGEYALPAGSSMKILGIVYDPPGPDLVAERIVLQNVGTTGVDLSGWTVRDAANHVCTFGPGTRAQPGEVLRLWTKTGTNQGADAYWNSGSPIWNNTPGDVARLKDPQGNDVDTYPYQRPMLPLTPGAVTPVGPGGGGAMYAAVVSPHDPNTLYVACDMGGLYRSDNGGTDWTILDGRQVFVGTSIDTERPRMLTPAPMCCHPDPARADWLVAMGKDHGLRVSTNRGAAWTAVPHGIGWPSAVLTAVGIDPGTGRLFVGTEDGAHFHDAGAGGTWSGTDWRACAGVPGEVVAFVLLGPGGGAASHVLATRGSVLRSGDGGATWQDVGAGLPKTVSGARRIQALGGGVNATLHPSPVLYATVPSTAADGGVYRSENAGTSWTRLTGTPGLPPTAGPDPVQYEHLGVSPNNPNLAYVTGVSTTAGWREYTEVFRTTDRGDTWSPVWAQAPLTGGWIDHDRPKFGGRPLGLGMFQHTPGPGNPASVVWTNLGSLYRTSDPGTGTPSWTQGYTKGTTPAPGQPWRTAGLDVTTVWNTYVDPHDASRHFLCNTDIGLMRSADSGQTWRGTPLPNGWTSNVYELAFDPTTPGRVWGAATDHHDLPYEKEIKKPLGTGGVIVSNDHGATWQSGSNGLPGPPVVSVVLDPRSAVGARHLWASVYQGGVFRTDDGGAQWHPASVGLPASPRLFRLHLHADGTLFCATSTTAVIDLATNEYKKESALYRSLDRGGSWEQVSELLEYVIDYAVHPVDSRVILLCTGGLKGADGAVRRTLDGGATWNVVLGRAQVLPGPPSDRFHAFAPSLHPLDPNVIFVGTNTHGAWMSRDAGTTWARFAGVTFPRVHRFRIEPGKVRVATHGAGALDVALS